MQNIPEQGEPKEAPAPQPPQIIHVGSDSKKSGKTTINKNKDGSYDVVNVDKTATIKPTKGGSYEVLHEDNVSEEEVGEEK